MVGRPKGWKKPVPVKNETESPVVEEPEPIAPVEEFMPPTRDQMIYIRGYDQGFADGKGFQNARILEALGVKIVAESLSPLKTETASAPIPSGESESTAVPSAPPDSSPSAPVPVCARCGHDVKSHEPLNANACFAKNCECKGYTNKKRLKLFGWKV